MIAVGCNNPSKSIRITVLLDHPVNDEKLLDNDTLTKLIEPFYYHDTLIAPIINFGRIDMTPIAYDSIRDDGVMKWLNEWMSGNTKNAQKIEKQLNIAIKKFSFNDLFLAPSTNPLFTDSIIVNPYKINAIIFTNRKANYSWVNSSIKVFDTVDNIHDYLGNLVLDKNNEITQVYLYYDPAKLTKLNFIEFSSDKGSGKDSISKADSLPSIVKGDKKIIKPPSPPINSMYDEFYKSVSDDEKLIVYFKNIFADNNNPNYKDSNFLSITRFVANLLIAKFPDRGIAYDLSCSYKTGFLSVVHDYLPGIDHRKLENSFVVCP